MCEFRFLSAPPQRRSQSARPERMPLGLKVNVSPLDPCPCACVDIVTGFFFPFLFGLALVFLSGFCIAYYILYSV